MKTNLASIFLSLALAACAASAAHSKPNILLIVADDLGWKDVGWHGAAFKTPAMDQLVRAGVELDQHYVQPLCTPTRVALLSGRYPSRFGPQALSPSNLRAMFPGTETIASALKAAGYATYVAGKWHLGSRPEWGPNQYGFEHSYGSLTGAVDPWTHKYRRGPYEDTLASRRKAVPRRGQRHGAHHHAGGAMDRAKAGAVVDLHAVPRGACSRGCAGKIQAAL